MEPADPSDHLTEAEARAAYVESMRALEAAFREASTTLLSIARRTSEVIDHVEGGGRVGDAAALAEVRSLRADTDEVIASLNRTRHDTRLWTAALASFEGVSLSEVARRYGVSRQYVSQLLKDHPVSVDADG